MSDNVQAEIDELKAECKELPKGHPERVALQEQQAALQKRLAALEEQKLLLLKKQEREAAAAEERQRSGAAAGTSGAAGPPAKKPRLTTCDIARSSFGKFWSAERGWQKFAPKSPTDEDAQFYGLRPCATGPPMALPASLVVKEFGQFIHELHSAPPARLPKKIGKLTRILVSDLPLFYNSEDERRSVVTRALEQSLQKHLTLMRHNYPSTSNGRTTSYKDDGSIRVNVLGNEAPVFIQEVKPEVGSNGDPYPQGMRYYQAYWTANQSCAWFKMDPCPAVVLEVVGNTVRVCGVACLQCRDGVVQVMAEPLSPFYHFGDVQQPAYMKQVQVFLWALRNLVDSLFKRYTKLHTAQFVEAASCMRDPSIELPYPLRDSSIFKDVQLLPPLDLEGPSKCMYHAKYLHAASSPEDVAVNILRGDNKWKKAFVKFTPFEYGIEVHEAWADQGLAPKVYAWSQLPGGIHMVIMEQLNPKWKSLHQHQQDRGTPAGQAVRDALQRAHDIELPSGGKGVHGDVRPPNIMVRCTKDGTVRVKFVDFEFAGEHDKKCYPYNLSKGIKWPVGAKACKVLKQEHDMEFANRV